MRKSVSIIARLLTLCLSFICLTYSISMYSAPIVLATDVNNVSGDTQESSEASEGTQTVADGLANAFRGSAVDNDDLAEATRLTAPAVKVVRLITSIILAMIAVVLGLITVLDLVYIMIPPTRGFLGGGEQQTSAPMGGGMMGSMMGGGMMHGGMSGGSAQGGRRIVSDEAIAALNESVAQSNQGGMGMTASVKPKSKMVILAYAKKRIVALICFFACLVLFTSTAFTDIGLYLGQWIVDTLGGFF